MDIQTIACQIAKLRFFISLAIEQQPDHAAENFGIKPLPNLETRFVAANTLLGLGVNVQLSLGQTDAVNRLQRQLNDNRERHFHATRRTDQLACRARDRELRQQLAATLREADFSAEDANRIAQWDPYDQNANAEWFDPGYMFGIADGFDVVIGNPPYIESRNSLISDDLKTAYGDQVLSDWGSRLPRGSDVLIYFYARSAKVLSEAGHGCLITQNAWLSTDYGEKFQKFSLGRFSFRKVVDSSAKFFSDIEGPNINAVVTMFTKRVSRDIQYCVADSEMVVTTRASIRADHSMKWGHLFSMPPFYHEVLSTLHTRMDSESYITFGQGVNPTKRELNAPGARIPIVIKTIPICGYIGRWEVACGERQQAEKDTCAHHATRDR